jgi:RP/EB family microtubule-associated protein
VSATANFKLLQGAFDKLKIAKHLEIQQLIRGRPLANLEVLQARHTSI